MHIFINLRSSQSLNKCGDLLEQMYLWGHEEVRQSFSSWRTCTPSPWWPLSGPCPQRWWYPTTSRLTQSSSHTLGAKKGTDERRLPGRCSQTRAFSSFTHLFPARRSHISCYRTYSGNVLFYNCHTQIQTFPLLQKFFCCLWCWTMSLYLDRSWWQMSSRILFLLQTKAEAQLVSLVLIKNKLGVYSHIFSHTFQ